MKRFLLLYSIIEAADSGEALELVDQGPVSRVNRGELVLEASHRLAV